MDELRLAFESGLDAIEADVSWNELHQVAVMKHAASSPETLVEKECLATNWLDVALKADKNKIKILKLDFKSLKAVPSVVDYLTKNLNDRSPEIFLNADILRGPGSKQGSAIPVDAAQFLKHCEALPDATLSLGWTTSYHPITKLRYEHEHVDEMLVLLSEIPNERITFPIRASLAFESWPALSRLLKHSPRSSLTLWTAHEGVPQSDLDWIVSSVEEHQLYVDCDKGPKHPNYHPIRLVHSAKWLFGL
jgi:hypothetical protein